VVHRDHTSVTGLAKFLPAVSGLLLKKEIGELSKIFTDCKKPFVLIVGGAKIDTKIGILKSFLGKADAFLVGGGLANTFLAAQNIPVGSSLYEAEKIPLAREILDSAEKSGTKIILPVDIIAAENPEADEGKILKLKDFSTRGADLKIFDIGPLTQKLFAETIAQAGTVVWNGPVGFFEKPSFAGGTRGVAAAVSWCPGMTIVGGGDTLEAIKHFQIPYAMFDHVSTGGGAMLEFLEGKVLPGLAVLREG
jgi:phosphoglycerate kinase